LFSATIAKDIATLARRYQRDALRIDTSRTNEAHGDIEYRAVRIAPTEGETAVVNILRYFESPGALIFCATRERVRHMHAALRERGFAVVQLSGELSQKERSDALQALRDGHARACIATDVADRGPEAVAAALVRLHRARLPEPEEILPDRGGEPRPLRPERRAEIDAVAGAWFRLPVGRSKNADPKWLVPLICRLGHVTKKDIGPIRIFDHETKFEIAAAVEDRFRQAIRAATDAGEIRINAASPPGPQSPRAPRPRHQAGAAHKKARRKANG
jgi:hypothetical protein